MHEMSRLPLRTLSNASAWPSFTSAGRTNGVRGSGTMPRPAASCRMVCAVGTGTRLGRASDGAGRAGEVGGAVRSEQAIDAHSNARANEVDRFVERVCCIGGWSRRIVACTALDAQCGGTHAAPPKNFMRTSVVIRHHGRGRRQRRIVLLVAEKRCEFACA